MLVYHNFFVFLKVFGGMVWNMYSLYVIGVRFFGFRGVFSVCAFASGVGLLLGCSLAVLCPLLFICRFWEMVFEGWFLMV